MTSHAPRTRFFTLVGLLGGLVLGPPATSFPAAALAAQRPPPGVEEVATVEGITEYRLENGLSVLLFPDPSQPQITVNVTYLVGSRQESYGETGMAHLLEHLLFQGTPEHPDIPQELSERGARPNGSTFFDRTNYYETVPASADNLAWALELEADRMVNSFVSGEDLESEMTVVRNEMEAGENSPGGMLLERVLSTQYLWHNYGKSTIGARSDVENVPIERLQAFYHKYYQPDNATLVVAGQFDPARALELVADHFGALPRPERTGYDVLWPTYTVEPTQDGQRTVTLRRTGDQTVAMMGYHVPPGPHADFAALDHLALILGDSPSGRLYQALVEPGLASSVQVLPLQLREASPMLLMTNAGPDADLERIVAVMDSTVSALSTDPVTAEEVARAKATLRRQTEQLLNSSAGVALQLSEWEAMGDWRLLFLHRDRVDAVTAADVQRVAEAYLKRSNRTVGRFVPTDDPDRAVIPDRPDVESLVEGYTGREAVAQGEAFDPSPSNIDARTETFTLANGLEVALLPKDTRGETVVARLRLHFGDAASLAGQRTAGDLAGSMLMRGTESRTYQGIQDELDRLQASGSLGGSATQGGGQFQTVRAHLPELLALMGELARTPSFTASEWDVLKEQRRTALEAQRAEPSARAQIALARHMDPWPPDHPLYTPTVEESLAALESTTLDDARSFYGEFWGPQGGDIVIVGDFDPDEVRTALGDAFGSWESPREFARIPGPYRDVTPEEIVIRTPDKANAVFLAQQNLALSQTDSAYPALVLAGYMIGGGVLNSRLATRIRTEEGLSYGVGGLFDAHPVDESGRFFTFAIHAPENADALEAAFYEELQLVLDDGFTPEEVAAAKQGWLESRRLSRAQDDELAQQMASHLYFDRTFTGWDAELEAAVRALTVQEVDRAVRRYLDPSRITVVKAGDFAPAPEG